MDEIVDLGGVVRFGLLSRAQGTPAETGVILFNAGLLHRPGPWRLHVHLARRLAALGVTTLRFDQPGVGDSLGLADRPQPQVGAAVVDAFLAVSGCRNVVVGGLCAAADLGWQVALQHEKVTGLLLLDPYARVDRWHRLARLQRQWRRPGRELLAALWNRVRRTSGAAAAKKSDASALRDWPEDGARLQMAALARRGVRVLAIYTGGASGYFLHPRQFRSTYGPAAASARVELEYWPDCDHLFYAPAHRQRLIDTVARWMTGRTGPA